MNKSGFLYALGAFCLWGFLPIFWKLLSDVPSLESLAHRVVWSMLLLVLMLLVMGKTAWIRPTLRDKRKLWVTLLASIMLSINWGLFIYAINIGEVLSASLGYYINPLLSVLIGVLFFRETLRPWQWVSIVAAASGVLWLTWSFGELPWIGLVLAASFGVYGALKKMAVLGPIEGLAIETSGVFLPALGYLIYLSWIGEGVFIAAGPFTSWMLASSAVATAVPLLLFAAAAQRIPLSMVGMMQYIAPTLQLLLGIFLYHEAFPAERLIGFAFIWLALIVFTSEGLFFRRKQIQIGAAVVVKP
ncbi:MAG: chloramphenicol-sensitive protein RarD [Cellvibrionaceae bacterium]|jgi:chloramphenicol-sensitive protein RarD